MASRRRLKCVRCSATSVVKDHPASLPPVSNSFGGPTSFTGPSKKLYVHRSPRDVGASDCLWVRSRALVALESLHVGGHMLDLLQIESEDDIIANHIGGGDLGLYRGAWDVEAEAGGQ